MTVRFDKHGNPVTDGSQVEIGGNERYESKCRRDYYELLKAAADDQI
jgi:thymidine kinase